MQIENGQRRLAEDRRFDPAYWAEVAREYSIPQFAPMELIDVDEWQQRLPLRSIALKARGTAMRLEATGGLPEVLNPYLTTLIILTGGPPGPIGRQFIANPEIENQVTRPDGERMIGHIDSLIEDEHEVVPGLIHKYPNRVLMLVTEQCAAYCRYCTRGRLVGTEGGHPRTPDEIKACFDYIRQHPEVEEVIFSGGDSFIVPEEVFATMVSEAKILQDAGQLLSVRFGTRSLIHNPFTLKPFHLEHIGTLEAPSVMLHYNHPAELTVQSVAAVRALRGVGARFNSQGVLLAGVNDDREILINKDRKANRYGIDPYYDFVCDEVAWATGFMIPFERLLELHHQRRAEMTGLAGRSRWVIDTANGRGKISLPEGSWVDERHFVDFAGQLFRVTAQGMLAVDSITE